MTDEQRPTLAGAMAALGETLHHHGVPERVVNELAELLIHEHEVSGIGRDAVGWIMRARTAVEHGGWPNANSIAITNAFLAYYGITMLSASI